VKVRIAVITITVSIILTNNDYLNFTGWIRNEIVSLKRLNKCISEAFRMQVWNVLHAARWKCKKSPKICHLGTIAQLCRAISSQLRYVSTIGKKLVKQQYLLHMPSEYNMVNFCVLAAIGSGVWDTPTNFNGFRVLAALLHGPPAVSVSQTLRRWTQGATYIRQGHHHVGHWPTF